MPTSARNHLMWWHSILSLPDNLRSLTPLAHLDPDIWVDASSSWGIGLVVGLLWAAWRLLPGWHNGDCDIGWAEEIALELAVHWLCSKGYHDADVIIHSDNSGVIGTFWKGRLHNACCKTSISCVSIALSCSNLALLPIFCTFC